MPTIIQSAFDHVPLGSSMQLALTNIQASNSVIVLGGALNSAAANIFPISISENVGDYTFANRLTYENFTDRRLGIYFWDQLTLPSGGDRTFTLTASNNTYLWMLALETTAAAFDGICQDDQSAPTTVHGHCTAGVTTGGDALLAMFIGSNNTANFQNLSYTRRSASGPYEARYAVHHGNDDLIADTIPIASGNPQVSHSAVAWYSDSGASPQPPNQSTPTPDFSIPDGTTGTIRDVSGDWTIGLGGTAPIDYAPVTLAAGFTITATGQIQSDGTPPPGSYANQQYQVDDAANNGPTLSNTFTITVDPPGAGGTLTTPPLDDGAGNLITGRTGMTFSIFPGESVTATPTLVLTNQSQLPDGTLSVTDAAITPGQVYTLFPFEPNANDAQAFYGMPYRVTAT